MGHGGHHHQEVQVPDFRKYNVEDVPLLMETKKRLALRGLSDPWLRNEVWRYQVTDEYPTKFTTLIKCLTRGFRYGVVLAIVATAISKTFARKPDHH